MGTKMFESWAIIKKEYKFASLTLKSRAVLKFLITERSYIFFRLIISVVFNIECKNIKRMSILIKGILI